MSLSTLLNYEFCLDSDICYLNHAAISPWPRRAVEAVKRFADDNFSSGAWHYNDWLATELKLRKQIQHLINAPCPEDIALLKNTSEALSVVACGVAWQENDNVVSTDEEFPSNRIVWQAQARHGVELRQISVMSCADPESALISACDGHTRVMAVSSVQYGTGLRLDLSKLGRFCRDNNIYFCVDAIQSIGVLSLDVQAVKADFVMADAHKWMCGPEGIALFYCRTEVRDELQLNQFGWHMVENHGNYDNKTWSPANSARRFECGSPNMLGIHGLSASLSLFEEIGMDTVSELIIKNVSYLFDKIDDLGLAILTPQDVSRRAGIVTFKLKPSEKVTWLKDKLLENKVICAQRMNGIRFSPHFYTDLQVIDKALDILCSNI